MSDSFRHLLGQLPPADPSVKHEWSEDELYGRYEITLTVDVGSSPQLHAATQAMREFAATLDVLGYETRAVYVVGGSKRRNNP